MTTSCPKTDTIFALATAQGRAGVAVMRISGPGAGQALRVLSGRHLPKPRRASLRILSNARGEKLDQALVLWFPGPASFTGEDMVELHCHGSMAVVEAVGKALFAVGLRQAEPGEFTRRAFAHGKLDLTEAEGLADLIDAQSTGQRRQALRQMGGGLRLVYEGWRGKILDALAMVEGEIDFPDEDGVPDALAARAGPILADVGADIEAALAESGRGETVRTGLDIAIIGAPNAGKSSILNRLARRDAAIVAKQAGTTRDIVDIHTHIAGLAVRIADTAGLRSTQDPVEAEGVRRAKLRAKDADLRLGVIDLANTNTEVLCTLQKGDIIVYNKTDIAKPKDPPENTLYQTFQVSAQTGDGFPALETALEKLIQHRYTSTEQAGLTRLRHRECAQNALRAVQSATNSLSLAPELAGADLHAALHAIKELAGESDIEAVLDRVFSQFCIGK